MTQTEKKAYFIAIQKRYHKANKAEKTQILNEVSLLNNYFLPSVKLQSKTRVGGKIIKVHDTPKTPAQRMLESYAVTQAVKKTTATKYKITKSV